MYICRCSVNDERAIICFKMKQSDESYVKQYALLEKSVFKTKCIVNVNDRVFFNARRLSGHDDSNYSWICTQGWMDKKFNNVKVNLFSYFATLYYCTIVLRDALILQIPRDQFFIPRGEAPRDERLSPEGFAISMHPEK